MLDIKPEYGRHKIPILNIGLSPIVYKYREGKLKRTRGRELKAPET